MFGISHHAKQYGGFSALILITWSPPVEGLQFHLPNQQIVIYEDSNGLEAVVDQNTTKQSMFLAWMSANNKHAIARELTYSEFPIKFVFKKDKLEWDLRQCGFAIGRLYNIPPGTGEAYYFRPGMVWQQNWKLMADDIIYKRRQQTSHPYFNLSDDELHSHALMELEHVMMQNGKSLRDYDSMPSPQEFSILSQGNRYMHNELNFDTDALRKTYLWQMISTSLRSNSKVVLNVASSGIASLLLPNGKIVHSQFVIPITITEDSVCNIKQGSHLAEVLLHVSLIIWDEAPMANKHCFEALDRTMRDIISLDCSHMSDKHFGGKVVIVGSD
ncbi:hypothetical protein K1719_039597 [Acacia pycnantha]|nr:hypothetical protein K1719_039597 [Acacia pycnantha]